MNEKMTLEKLATVVKEGFDQTVSKSELEELALMVKEGFDQTASKKEVIEFRDELRAEIRTGFIRIDNSISAIHNILDDHGSRITRVENVLVSPK